LSIRDPSFYNELYVTGSQRRSEHYDVFASGIDFEGIPTTFLSFCYCVKLIAQDRTYLHATMISIASDANP
jgi:hypothetical protein